RRPPAELAGFEQLRHRRPAGGLGALEEDSGLARVDPGDPGGPDPRRLPDLDRGELQRDAVTDGELRRQAAADAPSGEADVQEGEHPLRAALPLEAEEAVHAHAPSAATHQRALRHLPGEPRVGDRQPQDPTRRPSDGGADDARLLAVVEDHLDHRRRSGGEVELGVAEEEQRGLVLEAQVGAQLLDGSEGQAQQRGLSQASFCGHRPPGPHPRSVHTWHPGQSTFRRPETGDSGRAPCLRNRRAASTFRRPMPNASAPKDFQGLLLALQTYWAERGCALMQGYDLEVGAGTMNPATFLRVLGPEPWNVAYVEPSRRPADGRFGDNPNRLYQHHQYQVILKTSPKDVQEQYLGSLRAIGITSEDHDLRFVEDDWESPTLGAWGLGWEVWCDGMEVTQFTYFQQAGGFECHPVSAELTYGLERIAMYLQGADDIYDLVWCTYPDGTRLTYRDVFWQNEREQSEYSFHASDADRLFRLFDEYEQECRRLVELKLPLPAYDYCLKCSHA